MTQRKATLSYLKFTSLASQYGYEITNIFSVEDNIRLVELKTPVRSKTFFVYVPAKYSMSPKECKTEIHIPTDTTSTEKIIEYWKQIRLPEMSLNFVVFSGEFICYISMSGEITVYKIGQEIKKRDEKDDKIVSLAKEAQRLKLAMKQSRYPPIDATKLIDPIDPPRSNPSTLIFKDVDGDIIEPGSDMEKLMSLDVPEATESSTQVTEPVKEIDATNESIEHIEEIEIEESSSEEDEEINVLVNDVPEDKSLGLGMIYIAYPIKEFFTRTKEETFEFEVVKNYEELDEAEISLRATKMLEIDSMLDKAKVTIREKLFSIETEEKRVKEQIIKLSGIYHQARSLVRKSKTKRYTVNEEQTLNLESKTKEAITVANVELSRHKETANDIISKYMIALSQIFE